MVSSVTDAGSVSSMTDVGSESKSCEWGQGAKEEAVRAAFAKSENLWGSSRRNTEMILCKEFGGRTREIMNSAKKRHRTDISSRAWGKYEYHKTWEKTKRDLVSSVANNVIRIHGDCITMEEFHEKFERPLVPCVIEGLADEWPARTEWNLPRLRREFGERSFKCGEDDEGYPIKVKLKHFLRYQQSAEDCGAEVDDSPLYIFDSHFDDDEVGKQLLSEYRVPHLFNEDLFQLVGEKRRPPYRWILFGPTRSGSNIHTDPLGTSAWNTLIRGHKLWTLFPPDLPKTLVKGKRHVKWKTEDDEPIDWNVNLLPRILAEGGEELRSRMIQFIQRPGETVFVPTDWHHGVLNLDTTIAVTQNFCSSGNFEAVWRYTRSGRRKMARSWLKRLDDAYPNLSSIARHLDRVDNFDLEQEIKDATERHERKRERKKKKRKNDE